MITVVRLAPASRVDGRLRRLTWLGDPLTA
jgi:hypothetical protein